MSELMKDFCQTFITLILFYAILLLLINLLTLVKQKAHAHAPSFSPSTTVNINQYVTSTLDDYPDPRETSEGIMYCKRVWVIHLDLIRRKGSFLFFFVAVSTKAGFYVPVRAYFILTYPTYRCVGVDHFFEKVYFLKFVIAFLTVTV